MKKSSKKNYSNKKNKDYKKNSDFYYSKNTNRSEKNEKILNNSAKNNNLENLNKNDKSNTFSSLKESQYLNLIQNFQIKILIYMMILQKRNFDDWIWGKHSVYEALINERSINRIWCTLKSFLQ